MTHGEQYTINFGRLKPGKHEYRYSIDGSFFAPYEYSLIKECSTQTQLVIEKNRLNLMDFHFNIQGTLNLDCDRCLENLPYPVEASYSLVVKLEEMEDGENTNDEIVFLSPNAYEIDISKYIYDFHTLSIPFKKECQHVSKRCDELDALINGGTGGDDKDSEDGDPRWDDLKKLLK